MTALGRGYLRHRDRNRNRMGPERCSGIHNSKFAFGFQPWTDFVTLV